MAKEHKSHTIEESQRLQVILPELLECLSLQHVWLKDQPDEDKIEGKCKHRNHGEVCYWLREKGNSGELPRWIRDDI